MLGFEKRVSFNELENLGLIGLETELDSLQLERLKNIRRNWNFYKGYHWEDIPPNDKPQITTNFCRMFCDKLVAFELGNSFKTKLGVDENTIVTNDKRTLFEFLEDVWDDNDKFTFSTELGIMKSVTGDAWVEIRYYSPEELEDPFGEYPEGRIKITLLNTGSVFPEYDPHDKDVIRKVTIMYPIEKITENLWGKESKEHVVFKQVWTKESIEEYEGSILKERYDNRYGLIPIIQIKNLPTPNDYVGRSDIEDVIGLNMEYNMKCSDISEIIDYHASPVTVVYGAKLNNLEKGANKMWGGLPKDSRIENITMQTDLNASNQHIATLKLSMCESVGIPIDSLGGSQAISNTSGVALHYMNKPLIDKTAIKKTLTENGLETINKLMLLISLYEGLITNPNQTPSRDFFENDVKLPDTLPKDTLLELQRIQIEMQLGLEDRKGALTRIGIEDAEKRIEEIDMDRKDHPDIYSIQNTESIPEINSGMLNGEKLNSNDKED